jgi:hypothetical protein
MLAFRRKKKKRGCRLVLGLHNDAMERMLVLCPERCAFATGFFDYHACKFVEQYINDGGSAIRLVVQTRNMSMTQTGIEYQQVSLSSQAPAC